MWTCSNCCLRVFHVVTASCIYLFSFFSHSFFFFPLPFSQKVVHRSVNACLAPICSVHGTSHFFLLRQPLQPTTTTTPKEKAAVCYCRCYYCCYHIFHYSFSSSQRWPSRLSKALAAPRRDCTRFRFDLVFVLQRENDLPFFLFVFICVWLWTLRTLHAFFPCYFLFLHFFFFLKKITLCLFSSQERLANAHGSQCGFCTPGIVMSMYTLLRNCPTPSAEQVNMCMCVLCV